MELSLFKIGLFRLYVVYLDAFLLLSHPAIFVSGSSHLIVYGRYEIVIILVNVQSIVFEMRALLCYLSLMFEY